MHEAYCSTKVEIDPNQTALIWKLMFYHLEKFQITREDLAKLPEKQQKSPKIARGL